MRMTMNRSLGIYAVKDFKDFSAAARATVLVVVCGDASCCE